MRQKRQWCVKTSQPQRNTSLSRKIFLFTYTSAQERMMACNKRIREEDTHEVKHVVQITLFVGEMSHNVSVSDAVHM